MTDTSNVQDLMMEIGNYFSPSLPPLLGLSLSGGGSSNASLYEAYLFILVCKAAEKEGAMVTLRSIGFSNPATFVFRTSPGYISSRRSDYGYAILEFPGKPTLEVHKDIRVAGTSNVLHECDVCVLLKDEADLCRNSDVITAPRASKVIISVEAKFYTSYLGLGMGRAFLGFTIDVRSDKSFFVTNRTSASIAKLLSSKKRLWDHNIQPQNKKDEERLRNSFQTAFKDFLAKF